MTQTLNYQFFSIFPLNLGISFFIFFSIVFTGLLLSILMGSNIGRNIGKNYTNWRWCPPTAGNRCSLKKYSRKNTRF